MIDWLYGLPSGLTIAAAALLGWLAILATGLVARRLPENEARSGAALDAYKIIVTFTAILLSFSLVQANSLLRTTEHAVSTEAGAMNQMDRVLLRMQLPASAAARALLHDYIRAVMQQDWPAMAHAIGTSPAQQRLAALNRAVMALADQAAAKPQLFAEALKHLDAINDARQSRMDAVDDGLPAILWEAIALLLLVLTVLSAAIAMPARAVALGGHAVAIGVLVALTFVVDQPYRGSAAVSVGPIQRTLAQAQARLE